MTKKQIILSPEEQIQNLNSALKIVERDRDKYQAAYLSRKELHQSILANLTPIKPSGRRPRKSESKNKPLAVSNLVLTDWHIGERCEKHSAGQDYNLMVARDRMFEILKRYLSWTETMRAGYRIDTCHVYCLGDAVSGQIHPELLTHSDMPITKSVVESARLLAEVLERLSKEFNSVVVHEISADNHGRLGDGRPPSKGASQDNWTWLVHSLANAHVKSIRNITPYLYDDPMPVVEPLPGKYIRLQHGHQVAGVNSGPSPYYGISRYEARQNQLRYQDNLPPTCLSLHAHWHHFAVIEEHTIVCPSLIGPSEYSRARGLSGAPGQLAFLLSDRGPHGLTIFQGNPQKRV
jgi:hypothetical protein